MSARRAKPRKSNCCDSVGACSISIHPCQREIERSADTADASRTDDSRADFSGRRSFAVGRGHHLRFGFAIGRPNGIASRLIDSRLSCRVSTSDTKRRDTPRDMKCSRRLDAALVLASRAPLLAAQTATEHCRMLRVRIIFFEAIYFRFGASGRLSTAMIDANQQLIASSRWGTSTGRQIARMFQLAAKSRHHPARCAHGATDGSSASEPLAPARHRDRVPPNALLSAQYYLLDTTGPDLSARSVERRWRPFMGLS
jgi:hypothetical protein